MTELLERTIQFPVARDALRLYINPPGIVVDDQSPKFIRLQVGATLSFETMTGEPCLFTIKAVGRSRRDGLKLIRLDYLGNFEVKFYGSLACHKGGEQQS
jgi:hypothetical protein